MPSFSMTRLLESEKEDLLIYFGGKSEKKKSQYSIENGANAIDMNGFFALYTLCEGMNFLKMSPYFYEEPHDPFSSYPFMLYLYGKYY